MNREVERRRRAYEIRVVVLVTRTNDPPEEVREVQPREEKFEPLPYRVGVDAGKEESNWMEIRQGGERGSSS